MNHLIGFRVFVKIPDLIGAVTYVHFRWNGLAAIFKYASVSSILWDLLQTRFHGVIYLRYSALCVSVCVYILYMYTTEQNCVNIENVDKKKRISFVFCVR